MKAADSSPTAPAQQLVLGIDFGTSNSAVAVRRADGSLWHLPLADSVAAERSAANQGTPIFMAHGLMDPVVPVHRAEASRVTLQGLGYNVDWHTYPMPHSVHPQEVADIGRFLQHVLRSA